MKFLQEETFGPAIPLFKFSQDKEAVQLAKNTEYGLAAYFFTKVSAPNLLALPLSQIVKGGRRCSWLTILSRAWQPTKASTPALLVSSRSRIVKARQAVQRTIQTEQPSFPHLKVQDSSPAERECSRLSG